MKCTEQQELALLSNVKAQKEVMTADYSEAAITGRLTNHNFCFLKLMDGTERKHPVASSLNQPTEKGQILVCCLNPQLDL